MSLNHLWFVRCYLGYTPTNLKSWMNARRYIIDDTFRALQMEIKEYEEHPDEQPLRYTYSAFTFLALLVSKQFVSSLQEVLSGKCQDQFIFSPVSLAYQEMNRSYGAEPVRKVEDWEMRLWCEEKGLLPRRLTPEEQQANMPDFLFRRHIAFDRIRLSIDPFTPVEVAVKKMRMLIEERQNEYLKEIGDHERYHFDFARNKANQRNRSGEDTFFHWLRALKVYNLTENQNFTYEQAAEKIGLLKPKKPQQQEDRQHLDNALQTIKRSKSKAKDLIDAAWRSIPLAAVKRKKPLKRKKPS